MVFELISTAVQNILDLIKNLGYLGIFIGMVLESSVVPIPSELILIPAGALVAQGQMSITLVLASALLGSLMGSLLCYSIAFFVGRKTTELLIKKYGSLFFLDNTTVEKTESYFKNKGEITVFLGRLIFGIRHIISLPAGFAKMDLKKFTLFTTLGALIWSLVLITIGFFFGSSSVTPVVKEVTLLVGSLAIIAFVAHYLKKSRRAYKKKQRR